MRYASPIFLSLAALALGTGGVALAAGTAPPSSDAPPLPVTIGPTDPRVREIGRFDLTDPAGPRAAWPASTVELTFRGSALNVLLGESGDSDEYEVLVDGRPTSPLVAKAGTHLYRVFDAPAVGTHTVALIKRTEAFFGTGQFGGFQLSAGGGLLNPGPRSPRRLEVIGDSISCGYGDEAKDQAEHFSSRTENAALSYGDIAARALGAEYVCTAWSGRLMWPKNTMDEVYGRTLPVDPNSRWDFTRWVPQAVVINLGTNDFAGRIPEEKPWEAGYEAFIARVRKNYPRALIYCTSSPMMSGDKDAAERAYLHQIIADENAAGDQNVRFLDFQTQDAKNGFGADWHPSVKTQRLMADVLAAALQRDLGWKPVISR